MNNGHFTVGDRVVVSHEMGEEEGVVIGHTNQSFIDVKITVEFSDGTNSSWPLRAVRHISATLSK